MTTKTTFTKDATCGIEKVVKVVNVVNVVNVVVKRKK